MRLPRVLALCLAAALLFSAWPSPALAAPSEARVKLETTVNKVLAELNDPALNDPDRREALLARVENIILEFFDFGELSARSVGPHWKQFSDDQKKRFVDEFTTLLRENYLDKFEGYKGETVKYLNETSSTDGKRVEILTELSIGGKNVPVAYRLLNKSTWVVYDVVVEGISMVQNYRSQFQNMMKGGDAEQLIATVAQKAQEAREHNKKSQLK
jgi:ABC-type transport system involved in resistance to organic solvents, auxiliary component